MGFLQEVLGFLQEVPGISIGSSVFLQETSCRTFGRAKFDFGRESKGWNLFVRPATTAISTHHHMAPCSISLHLRHPPGYVFLHNHTRNPVFLKLTAIIFKLQVKQQSLAHPTCSSSISILHQRIPRQQYSPACLACIPGGEAATGHPTGIL